jgi:hypothetical protein
MIITKYLVYKYCPLLSEFRWSLERPVKVMCPPLFQQLTLTVLILQQ